MRKLMAKATAAVAVVAIGLFAVGCAAPAPNGVGNGAGQAQEQGSGQNNGGSAQGQGKGNGNGQGNGGGYGQGQGNGGGNGQGNGHHPDAHHNNGQGNGNGGGNGNGWGGNDVAEAPTVSNLGDFSAATIGGGTFSAADLAGKDITIVNFWSITCPPCVAEMPDLAEIQRELPANVQLITVLLDGQSGVQEAKSVLGKADYQGITLVPSANDGDLIAAVSDIMYMPTTVLYDAQGNALSEFVGAQADLEDTIENAVNHQLSIMGKPAIDL